MPRGVTPREVRKSGCRLSANLDVALAQVWGIALQHLADFFENAELAWVEDSKTLIPIDQPEVVTAHLKRFPTQYAPRVINGAGSTGFAGAPPTSGSGARSTIPMN